MGPGGLAPGSCASNRFLREKGGGRLGDWEGGAMGWPRGRLGNRDEARFGDWEMGRGGARGGIGRLRDWEIGTGNLSVHDMDSRVPSPFSSPPSNGDSKATVIYARGVIPLVN